MIRPDFDAASAALATMLVNERTARRELQERHDDLSQFLTTLFDADRSDLLTNGTVAFLEADGRTVTLDELAEQREQARRIAVHLEQENARILDTLARVQWLAEHWKEVGKVDGATGRLGCVLQDTLDGDGDAKAEATE